MIHAVRPPEPHPLARQRNRLKVYFRDQVWAQPLPRALTPQGLWFRLLRTLDLVINGFREDELRLHASALTYTTLVALVPILAMSLAVLKGLGYDIQLQSALIDYTAEMPEQFRIMVANLLGAVARANFAQIGGIGAVILLLTVVQMLSRIEQSFNRVWLVTRNRGWSQRFANYVSIVVVVPILLVGAIGLTAQVRLGGELIERLNLLRFAPFLSTWIAFSILYGAMPNTKVRLAPALASGFVGAVLWHLWFRFYITIQPGVTRYNLIYGTLASVPIFLVWLYFSWSIVLLGARVTFAFQNRNAWHPQHPSPRVNMPSCALLAIEITRACLRAFRGQTPPFHANAFGRTHNLQPELMEQVLDQLVSGGILAPVESEERDGYVLARDPASLTVGALLKLVLEEGEGTEALAPQFTGSPEHQRLERLLAQLADDQITIEAGN